MFIIWAAYFYLWLSGVNCVDFLAFPTDEIQIPQGNVTGLISLYGNIRKFLGIPYATVPKRFQAPSEPPKWKHTLYANLESVSCPQYSKINPREPVVGDEECLTLNIYTPITATNEPLSVMVFIHGGGWYWGSNEQYLYDPVHIVQKNVIVVTINYRLGALGFLCLENVGAPGNAGLKDQLAALKWVKNNIKYFGGDPNSITLFGEDAGASSISYFITSPIANGLFQKAIMESGTLLTPLAFDGHPIETASSVAADLGFNSTDPDELLEFFMQVPADDLIKITHRDQTNNAVAPYIFRPCAEKSNEALVTGLPINQLRSSKPRPGLKVIVGYNNKDALILASKYTNAGYMNLLKDLTPIIPDNINLSTEDDKASFIKEVKQMYFDDQKGDMYENLIRYFNDFIFVYPTLAVVESLRKSGVPVYNYLFKYDSIRNIGKAAEGMPREPGAGHWDELFYLFDPALLQILPTQVEDSKMIYKMTMMWASFAARGDPSIPPGQPWPVKWEETSDDLNALEIDEDLKMIPLPNKEGGEFWKNAYEKYGFK